MNECLTWASLSDKSALGEPLTGEERLFLRSHPSNCAACATEASLWDSLEKVLDQPERLDNRPGDLAERSSLARRLRRLSGRRWHGRRLLLAAAAIPVVAAAAAAAIWIQPPQLAAVARPIQTQASARPNALVPAILGGVRLSLAAGEISVNQRAPVAGEQLATGAVISVVVGEACLLVPPGVSVCLDDESELSIDTLEMGRRRLHLFRGHAVAHLHPQPTGSSFGFETPAGSVVAKGTVFSLKTDGSSVTLRVHEGIVLNSRGTDTNAYQAPVTALLSHENGSQALDATTQDSRLLELAKYFSDRSQGSLMVTAAAGSSVTLGDFPLGLAPLSALVQPGDYQLEVSRDGFAPIGERLSFGAESRIARAYEATSELPSTTTRSGVRSPRVPAAAGAAALLSQAQAQRAGARYMDANKSYQRLLREYPGSAEAKVALVSLGELQLSQLGDASAALRSFDAYLRGGGVLRQEASYGRIRALRRLGRLNEARAAADQFMSVYPKSVQSATLRKGLP